MTGRGQARMSHAARIATAIHMIWKYLFMSNSTELATTRFGTRNRATTQATRNQRARESAGREPGDDGEHERDARGSSGRRTRPRRARPGARLAPAQDEPERADVPLASHGPDDERQREDDRRQEQRGIAHEVGRRHAPVVRTYRPTIRYVAGKAKNWNGASSAATSPASRTPSGRRPRHVTTSSTAVTRPGRPRVVARCGQEARSRRSMRSGSTASRPPRCCRTTWSLTRSSGVADRPRRGRRRAGSSRGRHRSTRGSWRWWRPAGPRSGAMRAPRRPGPGRRRTARSSRSRPG